MIYALAILILTSAGCFALSFAPGMGGRARVAAWVGCSVALVVALQQEGLQGGGVGGAAIPWPWPDAMGWLGASFYRSDTLAASLGAWCILLGGLCLLRIGAGDRAPRQVAVTVLIIATLYSLVYTNDIRAFAGEMLLLTLLTWAILSEDDVAIPLISRQRVAQTAGALSLLGAALLMGRTTGGVYTLNTLTLSALTFWPLLLVILFAMWWLGLAPFTGWSALVENKQQRSVEGALVQGLVVGLPVLVLVIRLQALITQQALAGSVPDGWVWFTGALAWLGGVTTLVAGASAIVWAGTARWSSAMTACMMGVAAWSLGLDSPTGRYAAIAIFLAYGPARLTLAFSGGRYDWLSRLAAGVSMAGAPLTVGFVGVWLLVSGLQETRHPVLAIVLVAGVILAACGTALHLAVVSRQPSAVIGDNLTGLFALVIGAVSILGGALPGVWLPQVEKMASIAGGGSRIDIGWAGLVSGGLAAPISLLALGVLLLGGLGWLLRNWAKSSTNSNSVLLPTAVARLQKERGNGPVPTAMAQPLLSNPPAVVWWLSLVWLERGIYGFGMLLNRVSTRFGMLLARLEGRYYFPLALILTLLVLLAITR